MRILLYNETFFPSVGGVETIVRLLADYLREHGEDVVVATQTSGTETDRFPIVRQPGQRSLARLVKDSDLIHLNCFHPQLFWQAKVKRKKLVCTYHDLTLICPKGNKFKPEGPCLHRAGPSVCHRCLLKSGYGNDFRKLMRPATKSLLSAFVHANICISAFALNRFALWRKQLILAGIDTSRFRPNFAARRRLQPRVVFVGRLVPEKGCHVLIDALRFSVHRAAPFELDIVGIGPEQSRLESLIDSLGLQRLVCFHGVQQNTALVEILQQADIAVVPSLWDEPFGLVAIEAMACGLPVIAADVGGLTEITARAGLSFPRGDAKALSDRIEQLLADEDQRRTMGIRSREVACEIFDYRIMAAHYHRLFRQLVRP